MPYRENLQRASALKQELDSFRPLTPEVEQRIMQKFRLDWNYHSSHIEGNTLTYGETKALILFGQTAQAKPLKDHLEMTGHNEAIKYIEEIVKQERPLTESFIREMHTLILKEPYEVDAITPDGKPTRRTISIGCYKAVPNHVKTKTGEIFYFASPEETPAKMADLMEWFNQSKENSEIHPVLLATEFHYRFIRIHPFDDGNGRLARLLMNFILMQKGYPPAIIKTEDKSKYFGALQQADAGQHEFFFNYICQQINYSLELMIKGAKGESIDDPDDLDKKLALLEKELEAEDADNEIQTHLSTKVMNSHFNDWIFKILETLIETTNKFSKYYLLNRHSIQTRINNDIRSFEISTNDPLDNFKVFWNDWSYMQKNVVEYNAEINFYIHFEGFKKGGLKAFGCNYTFKISFEQYTYEVLMSQFAENNRNQNLKQFVKKLLHKPVTENEMKEINKQWGNLLLQHMEYYWKKQKENDLF